MREVYDESVVRPRLHVALHGFGKMMRINEHVFHANAQQFAKPAFQQRLSRDRHEAFRNPIGERT